MKIAVLSGKGGTGKTFLSVNIAYASKKSTYIDCDVEEPNGHLFLKPEDIKINDVSIEIPHVDVDKCSGCRKCIDFCKFNALAYVNNHLFIFDEVCHSCGGCILFCPEKALVGKKKKIGEISQGKYEHVNVVTGKMNTGEASGVPIIKEILRSIKGDKEIHIIDCPPGSACIVMESIKDADYCILVAEPSIFGAHNLSMVYDLVKLYHKPHGVVLNKCMEGENPSEKFCREKNIKIIGKIPFDQTLGYLNSNALIVSKESIEYYTLFRKILYTVIQEVRHEAVIIP